MNILKGVFSRIKSFFKWFQNASLKKKIIIVLVVGILLFLISGPLLSGNKQSQITTDTVKRATIIDTVSESGNIQSNQLTVYSVSNGVIEELYVENGQTVKKGDKLFEVKSTATEQEKAAAYATYLSAVNSEKTSEANKTSAQSTLEKDRQSVIDASSAVTNMENNRNNGLNNPATKQAYTQNDIDSINSALTSARTTFTADEAKYNTADNNIGSAKSNITSAWLSYQATQDATVTAQVSGVVANLSYSVGDQVTASMNTSSNTNTTASSVLVIGTQSESVVKIQINEVDIDKVKVGQKATVTVSAIKDKTFNGEVTRVDDYGTDTSGVITYNVFIKVTNPDEQIRPLMSAVVVIQTTKHENVLVVPNSAIKPYKGGKAVQIRDTSKPGNQLKYVQVKTGIKNTSQTEIIEGLKEGTEIVISTTASTTTTKSSGGILGGPSGN